MNIYIYYDMFTYKKQQQFFQETLNDDNFLI